AEPAGEDSVPLPLRTENGQMPHAQVPDVRDAKEKNEARIVADRLKLGAQSFFIRGIRQNKAPVHILKEAGFNTVFTSWANARASDTAANFDIQMVPMIGEDSVQNASQSSPPFGLAIYLGDDLDLSEIPKV